MKNLPRTLVLKQLINHKDKVRRRASRILAPARRPLRSVPCRDSTRCLPPTRVSPPRGPPLVALPAGRSSVRRACLSDVLRIFAPEEPYENDETLKSVYRVHGRDAVFGGSRGVAFQPAHAMPERRRHRSVLPMLDLECPGADRLVDDLFEVMFQSVNPTNSSLTRRT